MASNACPQEYSLIRWDFANACHVEMKCSKQLRIVRDRILEGQEFADNLHNEATILINEIRISCDTKVKIYQEVNNYLQKRNPEEAAAERELIKAMWAIQEEILTISNEFTSVLEEEHIEKIRLNPYMRKLFYYTDGQLQHKWAQLDKKEELNLQYMKTLDNFLALHYKHSPTGALAFDGYSDGDVNAGPQFSPKN
jgi:hypothetical protein